jgi:hypothetical protein
VRQWITLEDAARAVHAPPSLIQQWVCEGRVTTALDPTTRHPLLSADDVEDVAEEEALRLLSYEALAQEGDD